MKISYCTSCKGRLWQLEKVLFDNLTRLSQTGAEWLIFDYHCPDKLFEKLSKNKLFRKLFETEQVKMFKLSEDLPYSMPLAKNASHLYSTGDFLFNLDADNYISNSHIQIEKLTPNQYLWVKHVIDNGTCGRIGVPRVIFEEQRGYDLALVGAGYEDLDFINRLNKMQYQQVKEKTITLPIQNTRADTLVNIATTLVAADIYEENYYRSQANSLNRNYVVNPNGLLVYENEDISGSIFRIE